MKYFEWDRLRLDKSYEAGHLISKASVYFELFKTYRKRVTWSSMLHHNMSLFYGNLNKQKTIFIQNIAKQSIRFSESVKIDLYNFTNDLEIIGEELEQKYEAFHYHHYLNSFEQFIDDLIEFRQEIRTNMIENSRIEATNRKLQFILIDLTTEELSTLHSNSDVYDKFQDLLSDSEWERVYIVPLVKNASDLPLSLHHCLEWCSYLGSVNDDFLHEMHPDLIDGYYSKQQKVIGSAYTKDSEKITILHPLKYTPSQFHYEVEERFREEDELYKEFLNSLNDGSR